MPHLISRYGLSDSTSFGVQNWGNKHITTGWNFFLLSSHQNQLFFKHRVYPFPSRPTNTWKILGQSQICIFFPIYDEKGGGGPPFVLTNMLVLWRLLHVMSSNFINIGPSVPLYVPRVTFISSLSFGLEGLVLSGRLKVCAPGTQITPVLVWTICFFLVGANPAKIGQNGFQEEVISSLCLGNARLYTCWWCTEYPWSKMTCHYNHHK